ncbi:growth hormone secretagogue receptor type 1-like [Clytia hemisphaerica]|uniref:G-protein coupled receptors family 1 profile domain-containing protein n=1 Tax=Clytia hemisphaerica TaxID=252671 RepID=A0A7M5UVD8_9CNID
MMSEQRLLTIFVLLVFIPTLSSFIIDKNTTLKDLCASNPNITKEDCNCEKHQFFCMLLQDRDRQKGSNSTPQVPLRITCDEEMGYMRGVSNIIIGGIGIIGNVLVITVSFRYYWMTTRCHVLITILAFTDLATCIIRLWRNIPFLWTCHWVYSALSCKVGSSLLNTASYISMGLIVLIAVERYLGICHPFRTVMTKSRLVFLLLVNVAVGLLITTSLFLYTNLNVETKQCEIKWPSKKVSLFYAIINLIFFSLLPALVLAILYQRIIKVLKSTTRNLFKTNSMCFNSEKRRIKDNERIMKMVVTISVLFVALVFPNRIMWIAKDSLELEGIRPSKDFHFAYVFFAFIIYSLHAIVNPIIYSLMDKTFRRKAINTLMCKAIPRNKTDIWANSNTHASRITRLSTFKKENRYSRQIMTSEAL